MEQTPTQFWLTDVRYLEGKRAILAEFSHLSLKRMARQPFFPSFFVSEKAIDFKALKKVLSCDKRRFRLRRSKAAFKVSAATFSGLNQLAELLFRETGFRSLVLEPERQFLLERQWSYFDCFTSLSEKEFLNSGLLLVPKAKLGLFSEPLHETVRQAAELQPSLAEKILESLVLSNSLKLPLCNVPNSRFLQQETLLQNLFWKTGLGVRGCAESHHSPLVPKESFSASPCLTEVDFALLWPTLLTKPVCNLGPDSVDCFCCKPHSVSEKNVLPSSLALVEMLQDGFFFESCSASFARDFHRKNPGMKSRLRRMQEFCLKAVPIGPFFREQKIAVPLIDALELAAAKKANLLAVKEMHWFCLQKESIVSKAVFSLNKRISLLEKKVDETSSRSLKQHGILGPGILSTNPDFLLQQAFLKATEGLLRSIPRHLCNGRSAFFNERLCFAIEAVEANVLNNFKRFAAKKKSRVVSLDKTKVFVLSDRSNSLIRQFSEKQTTPALIRASSWSK